MLNSIWVLIQLFAVSALIVTAFWIVQIRFGDPEDLDQESTLVKLFRRKRSEHHFEAAAELEQLKVKEVPDRRVSIDLVVSAPTQDHARSSNLEMLKEIRLALESVTNGPGTKGSRSPVYEWTAKYDSRVPEYGEESLEHCDVVREEVTIYGRVDPSVSILTDDLTKWQPQSSKPN